MKTKKLESGDIYFLDKIKEDAESNEISKLQRFFIILNPDLQEISRLIVVGAKKMPDLKQDVKKSREGINWSKILKVDRFNYLSKDLNVIPSKNDQALDKGQLVCVGIGRYTLRFNGEDSRLSYSLTYPKKRGEIQKSQDIERNAEYLVAIKNPRRLEYSDGSRDLRNVFDEVSEEYKGLNWIPIYDSKLLNNENIELLIIVVDTHIDEDEELRKPLQSFRKQGQLDSLDTQNIHLPMRFRDLDAS